MTRRPQPLRWVLIGTLAMTTLAATCQTSAGPQASPQPTNAAATTAAPTPPAPTPQPLVTAPPATPPNERSFGGAVPDTEPPCGIAPITDISAHTWLLCNDPAHGDAIPVRVQRSEGSLLFVEPTLEESAAGLWNALPADWLDLAFDYRRRLGNRVHIDVPLPNPTNAQLNQLLHTLIGPPGQYWYWEQVQVCGDTCARYGWTDTGQPQRLECANEPPPEIPNPAPLTFRADDAPIGDVDGDGLADNYLRGGDDDPAYVLFGNGNLSPPLRPLRQIYAAVDFNNDGADELVISAGGATGHGAGVAALVDGCFLEPLPRAFPDSDELKELFLLYTATGNSGWFVTFGVSCPELGDGSLAMESGNAWAIVTDLNGDGVVDGQDESLAIGPISEGTSTLQWQWTVETLRLQENVMIEDVQLRRSGVAASRADVGAFFPQGGNCPAGDSWF